MVNLFLNMNIDENKNKNILVFVHIPKTAGTSLHEAFVKKFKLTKEEFLKNYPNCRGMPERERYCVNYQYIGHWSNDSSFVIKPFSEFYNNNYAGTLSRTSRWIPSTNSKIKSPISNNYIQREVLNYVPLTVVRCPYERFISAYKYFLVLSNEKNLNGQFFFDKVKNIFFNKSGSEEYIFCKFIETLNNSKQYIIDSNIIHLRDMTSFISENNKILIESIIKYENLDEDVNSLLKKYEYGPIDIKHLNVGPKKYNYLQLLDKDNSLKEIIYNFYKNDFENFNYKK
jgi:hypothetical protein